jgi:hypothetical protein
MTGKCLLTFVLICATIGLCAQVSSDTLLLTKAVANSIHVYEKAMNGNFIIHNGTEYIEPERTNETHPFFISEDWLEGSVDYDGAHFDHVQLLYDITSDALVAESPASIPIVLIKDKLKKFTIAGHNFIKLSSKDFANSLPVNGFYELIYSGATQVIVLHQKSNEETVADRTIQKFFTEKNRHYISKNGTYHHVRGKHSLLKILADQKTELRRFIRAQNLDFHHRLTESLVNVAARYDIINSHK